MLKTIPNRFIWKEVEEDKIVMVDMKKENWGRPTCS